jgi:uncharacterized membrane protein
MCCRSIFCFSVVIIIALAIAYTFYYYEDKIFHGEDGIVIVIKSSQIVLNYTREIKLLKITIHRNKTRPSKPAATNQTNPVMKQGRKTSYSPK